MRYHNITKDDMRNGDGLRVVLWVAGCSHKCKGCQNPITWDSKGGIPFDDSALSEIYDQLNKNYISGITYSGGDPLFYGHRDYITQLASDIWKSFPDKTQWMYTGYVWEDVCNLEVMKYIDILVDGKYDETVRDVNLHWVGSENQRVIDVKETLKAKKIILHK